MRDARHESDLIDGGASASRLPRSRELSILNSTETRPSEQDAVWCDTGIRDVAVAALPAPDDIQGPDDFKKVPIIEMRAGIERLQSMKPLIDSGRGASSDFWADFDAQQGLEYGNGYQRVFDSFYGQDAIRLDKDSRGYSIINGRHRIFVAKSMGVTSLPARVIERR